MTTLFSGATYSQRRRPGRRNLSPPLEVSSSRKSDRRFFWTKSATRLSVPARAFSTRARSSATAFWEAGAGCEAGWRGAAKTGVPGMRASATRAAGR
jgi:hypothetical protein